MRGRYVLCLLLAVTLIMAWSAPATHAATRSKELTELSIDELLEVSTLPSNVLGSHVHREGEWMVGYKYMFLNMGGNRSGTNRQSPDEMLRAYVITPIKMNMQMHMFEVMRGITDRLTLMGMFQCVQTSMDHVNRPGVRFTTHTEGMGDTQLMAHYEVFTTERERYRVIVVGSLSLPTGSIDETGLTPLGYIKLPYPMQLGSGTYDLMPGVTYIGKTDRWSWSGHVGGTIRLGDNSNHYTLSDRVEVHAWLARQWTPRFSTHMTLDWEATASWS